MGLFYQFFSVFVKIQNMTVCRLQNTISPHLSDSNDIFPNLYPGVPDSHSFNQNRQRHKNAAY